MKVKCCPKCGGTELGDRWVAGRKLQQFCYIGYSDEHCGWEGDPRVPEKKRITNKDRLRIDNFPGWHYIIYDKYGHVQTDSATHSSKQKAMAAMERDMTPKKDYVNPAAPLTGVLFFVPTSVVVTGTKFKYNKGKMRKVK